MSHLALVAVLLLLAVPTVGRVLSGSGAASEGIWTQMCTMAGLKLVKIIPGDLAPIGSQSTPDLGSGGDGSMPGSDCAYCPLLGAMVALALWIVFGLPAGARQDGVPRADSPLTAFRHPSGLGSRGPPIEL
jgi:hypothetical protein